MLSRRSQMESELNRRAQALARARQSGEFLWDLSESNPTRAGISYDEQAIIGALGDRAALRYAPEPLGLSSARQAVAEHWFYQGVKVDPERILLTASTSEAYSFLLKLLCDPGDEILVPRPSYPLFETLAGLENVVLRGYRLDYDGAWHIDFESLAQARTARSRAIFVVNPNNPTGSYLKKSELSRLCALGLPIASDEVFGAYSHSDDPSRVRSVLETEAVLCFGLGGLSKFAALPQMKLAWTGIAGPQALVSEAVLRLEHISDAFLSVSTPVQLALPTLLTTGQQAQSAIRERLRRNFSILTAALASSAATPLYLEGGWYAVLRLPTCRSEEDWAIELIESARVVVEPGYFYDFEREPFMVVSLLTPEPVFAEGVTRLANYVQSVLASD